MIEVQEKDNRKHPNILILGVGGGGNNAICRMLEADSASSLHQVSFAVVNTDLQVLNSCNVEKKVQIGKKLTGGFGAGSDPSIGEASATESREELNELIKGYHMVILTCGMGGGTGTGAIPVIAQLCKEANILTVAVVTLPFSFESQPRILAAQHGVETLKQHVDTLLVIPNDKLLTFSSKPFYLEDAFATADTVLRHTIAGITNIIYNQGIINLDFNDLKMTLSNKGIAHLGIGTVNADASILEAVKEAINSPLLETNISGATNILINSSGKINLLELNEAISYVRELAGQNVNIIWGTVTDSNNAEEKIVITLIATGMEEKNAATAKELPFKASVPPVIEPHQEKIVRPQQIDIVIPSFLANRVGK